MPGSIRDKISTFENLANSSLASSQLMPIVPPSPGFSYTKKLEKLGVRAKETSRVIPFEYKKKIKVEEAREERHVSKIRVKGSRMLLEKDDAPRDEFSDTFQDEVVDRQEDIHSESNQNGPITDTIDLNTNYLDSQRSKQEDPGAVSDTIGSDSDNTSDQCAKQEDSRSENKENISIIDNIETDSYQATAECAVVSEMTAGLLQEQSNIDEKVDDDDISFGEYVSAEADDDDLQYETESFDDNTSNIIDKVSKNDDECNDSLAVESSVDATAMQVANNTLRLINEKTFGQKDEMDETEQLEKISQQHLAIFDEDINDEKQYTQKTSSVGNDIADILDEDELSGDLLGVYIDDESIVSENQEGISAHPRARHFHFEDGMPTNHLPAIQETIPELEKDDYGPRKMMTPTRQDTQEYYEDYGVRSNISHNDDVVSQLTEGSFETHRPYTSRKWRTSLDDHKPGSVSEHSSTMTYDLDNYEEENIMEPRQESAQIFRQRNSLLYNQIKSGTDSGKIDVSESTISEITNPTYDKNNAGILNCISGSDFSEERNILHRCKLEDVNCGKPNTILNTGKSNIAVVKARRGRSRTASHREKESPAHMFNDNKQKSRFSIRSLSPFRRGKSNKSEVMNKDRDKECLEIENIEKHLQIDQENDRTKTQSFSFRSLSPFRRMPTEVKTVSIRKSKSSRKKSPFRRPMNTPSDIIQYDEESRNSIPLLAVASNETSTSIAKKEKFSFRSLSPFRRRKSKSRHRPEADPFDEGDGSV